jgi:hypothetical protein
MAVHWKQAFTWDAHSSSGEALISMKRVTYCASSIELELELTQAHMTQKPLLWVEVGAHAVRKRSEAWHNTSLESA